MQMLIILIYMFRHIAYSAWRIEKLTQVKSGFTRLIGAGIVTIIPCIPTAEIPP